MTGLEWENFKKLNNEEYKIDRNKEFINYYQENKDKGYYMILNIREIQMLIDDITRFFEFKYPGEMLSKLKYEINFKDNNFIDCIKVSKQLDINQLKYRLSHDQLRFLECSYGNHIRLTKPRKKIYDIPYYSVRIDSKGYVEKVDLEGLKFDGFLQDIDGVNRIEDLLGRYMSIDTDVDFSELKRHVENHKVNVVLRNKVLQLVMLSLMYSNGELPEFGYTRAKSFMRMFNREYNLNLDMDRLDEIMRVDYSNSEDVKRKIKELKYKN